MTDIELRVNAAMQCKEFVAAVGKEFEFGTVIKKVFCKHCQEWYDVPQEQYTAPEQCSVCNSKDWQDWGVY